MYHAQVINQANYESLIARSPGDPTSELTSSNGVGDEAESDRTDSIVYSQTKPSSSSGGCSKSTVGFPAA